MLEEESSVDDFILRGHSVSQGNEFVTSFWSRAFGAVLRAVGPENSLFRQTDREQFVFGTDVDRFVSGDGGAVDTAAHVDLFDRFRVFGTELEREYVAVFITDVDFAIGDQRTAPSACLSLSFPWMMDAFSFASEHHTKKVGCF